MGGVDAGAEELGTAMPAHRGEKGGGLLRIGREMGERFGGKDRVVRESYIFLSRFFISRARGGDGREGVDIEQWYRGGERTMGGQTKGGG